MKGRFNRFVKFLKPELHIHKADKDKDQRIEEFIVKETQWKIERSDFIKQIRVLERRVAGSEDRERNKDIKIERLYDAVYMMLGSIDLDPSIKRQVEAKLK